MKTRFNSLDAFSIFVVAVWVVVVVSWFINIYMLTQCDFSDDNLKCEIVHTVGTLAPPLAPVMIFIH